VLARAPASSANLGPGFDTLAVAVARYIEVEVTPADRLSVHTEGDGADLPQDADHLAARVASMVLGHDRVAIRVKSEIPVARGMGSSAALAVATAVACGATDPLAIATEIDGHAENGAASAMGGLVAAIIIDGQPVAHHLPLDPELVFVVLVPDRPLSTVEARIALPDQVSHDDASFNLGRMALLLAGLADHRELVPAATEDKLHQPPRNRLFPEAPCLMEGLVKAGALASCWSGAGPSLLGICTRENGGRVRQAGEDLLRHAGVPGFSLLVEADTLGVQVLD
jgi:homoserine kinase